MRIALVNDQPIVLESLRRIVQGAPGCSVAWTAKDGAEAVESCAKDRPDLILMDLVMPVMSGVESTRRIMAATPCPILLVTSSVQTNYEKVFDALGYGALDAIDTPGPQNGGALIEKINRIRALTAPRELGKSGSMPAVGGGSAHRPLLVVGSSTGGPQALERLFTALPGDLPAPAVVIQHLDSHFAAGLRDWLKTRTALKVELALGGVTPANGTVYLAETNDHLVLTAAQTFQYVSEPLDYSYRPSVDVFMRSARAHWPGSGAGVLLTGMGRDGAAGLLELRRAGWHTIAQDQATCVVYGMPKAAMELGAACEILALDQIATSVTRQIRRAALNAAPH